MMLRMPWPTPCPDPPLAGEARVREPGGGLNVLRRRRRIAWLRTRMRMAWVGSRTWFLYVAHFQDSSVFPDEDTREWIKGIPNDESELDGKEKNREKCWDSMFNAMIGTSQKPKSRINDEYEVLSVLSGAFLRTGFQKWVRNSGRNVRRILRSPRIGLGLRWIFNSHPNFERSLRLISVMHFTSPRKPIEVWLQ